MQLRNIELLLKVFYDDKYTKVVYDHLLSNILHNLQYQVYLKKELTSLG